MKKNIVLGLGLCLIIGALLFSFGYVSKSKTKNFTLTDPKATVATTTEDTKYEQVSVFTEKREFYEDRATLLVSYPVTEVPKINKDLKTDSEEFISEFISTARKQEELYQLHLEETGVAPVSSVTQYLQHFDVAFANEKFISFRIERYRNTGGTGLETVQSRTYDRTSGNRLANDDIFVKSGYLNELSERSRADLIDRLRKRAQDLDNTSDKAKEEYIGDGKEMIRLGTEPKAENFDGLVLTDEQTVVIYFDKYQVGPGSDGVMTVTIPLEELREYLSPAIAKLLLPEKKVVPPTPLTPAAKPSSPKPDGNIDCGSTPCVALTFDDGPSVFTERLLDTLKRSGVPATFFVLGQSAKIQPDTIKRMVDEGHQVANHSWNHKNLKGVNTTELSHQINDTDHTLKNITGYIPPYFRPPYGSYDDAVVRVANRPIILWSIDPEDWKRPPQDTLIASMSNPKAGDIILAHDIHQGTVDAIPKVIENLQKAGFTLVTVDTLLGENRQNLTYRRRP